MILPCPKWEQGGERNACPFRSPWVTLPLNLFFPPHFVLFPSALIWAVNGTVCPAEYRNLDILLWKNTLNVRKWYNMNEINWYLTSRFFFFSFFLLLFTLFFHFFYLIFCVNIQLNMHFYIFFHITIYSYGSVADEIWWTFYKRTNWASRKKYQMDYEFFLFLLSFELVNSKHRLRIYARV